jgi:ubiquitin-protein ligase
MSGGVISKAVQRIMKKDLPSVQNDDMKSNGIYYFMDEKSVMKGTALIIGPGGTPYEGGYWFFSVEFNDNHPFEPPQVLTLTQDGRTRFNPNMYREGKVCLSLLGTWSQGDKWTSVQTLGSVLLSILGMVLTDQPLRNEPCFSSFTTHTASVVLFGIPTWASTALMMLAHSHEVARPSHHALALAHETTPVLGRPQRHSLLSLVRFCTLVAHASRVALPRLLL